MFTFNNLRFSLSGDWHDLSVVTLVNRSGRANVIISRELDPGIADLGAHAKKQSEMLKRQVQGYVHHRQEDTRIGKDRAVLLEHGFASQGTQVRQLQVLVARGGFLYTVSMTDVAADFEASRAAFNEVLGSLQIG